MARLSSPAVCVHDCSSFLAHNQFQWTSRYEVFGTNTFAEGALVTASTETPEIKYGKLPLGIGACDMTRRVLTGRSPSFHAGQTAIIDKDGSMGNAKGTPDSSGTFTVDNEYAALNIGVMGYLSGTFSPIFVSPSQVVTGPVNLTPVESVLVWFDAQHTTSTIIVDSVSNTIEVSQSLCSTRAPAEHALTASGRFHWGLRVPLCHVRQHTRPPGHGRVGAGQPTPALCDV